MKPFYNGNNDPGQNLFNTIFRFVFHCPDLSTSDVTEDLQWKLLRREVPLSTDTVQVSCSNQLTKFKTF